MLDTSGNALHGRLLANAHVVSDPLRGNVLSLDGQDDCVNFGTSDRFNITGSIDYLTPAVSASNAGHESTFNQTQADVGKLVDGTNVLAVEMHRAEDSGSGTGVKLLLVGATEALVPWGSTWKYLDDGSDQGTAWYDPSFDDSSWASGPAELGHGRGDPATVVNWGLGERHTTHYFRHTFNVSDVSNYRGLHLGIKRDDGAVVYLNGNEVCRDNMPIGTVTYATRASHTVGSSHFCSFLVDPNNLVDGTNIIAVEIHQRLGGSGDISFDLNLAASIDSDTLVSPDAAWSYLDDGSDQGTAWYGADFDDSGWACGSMKLSYDGAGPKDVTSYFRHSFNVPDVSIYSALGLELTSDDGAVIYLNGTEISRTNMPCDSMTVAAWVKVREYHRNWNTVISKGDAWNLNLVGHSYKEGIGVLQFKYTEPGLYGGRARINGDIDVRIGKWCHVAAVCDGTRIHLYVNGRKDKSGRAFGTTRALEYPVVVGENWENAHHEFNGLIDDACIYSYPLSAAEVQALYRGNGPGPIEKPKWAVSAGL
jgi:hypothetical protein